MKEDLKNLVADVLKENKAATPEMLLEKYAHELTVDADRLTYTNPRVTAGIDAMSDTEVTHVKFFPLVNHGYIVVTPAKPGEPGAIEFERSASRRTGQFRFRTALAHFDLKIDDGHKVKLPVSLEEIETEEGKRTVMLVRVKRPVGRKAVTRKSKASPALAQAAAGSMGLGL